MKKCITLIFMLITVLSGYGQEIAKKQVSITGKLINNPNRFGPKENLQGIKVELKAGQKVLTTAYTQEGGRFSVTFTPPDDVKTLDFICWSLVYGSAFTGYVLASDSSNRAVTMYLPAIVKKTFLKDAICPKCGKANKTRTIKYGIDGEGGCLQMMAEYLCSRDGIRF